MKKEKLIWLWIITLLTFISNVNAVIMRTFRWNVGSEVSNTPTQVDGSRSIFDMIKVVNKYLRFGVWFVCFLFMVINGYKLITAHGEENQTKNATKALLKSLIWIAICLLAYIIVNLAVKIFA